MRTLAEARDEATALGLRRERCEVEASLFAQLDTAREDR